MSVRRENERYLKGLAKELAQIPTQLTLMTAQNLLLKMVGYTRVDTGQAALHWEMMPFRNTYETKEQRILWGTGPNYENPYFPVLSKMSDEKNDMGTLLDYALARSNYVIQTAPRRISGVVVYNPISPGFSGFTPGNDWDYADNALSEAEQHWASAYEEALREAETVLKVQFAALH